MGACPGFGQTSESQRAKLAARLRGSAVSLPELHQGLIRITRCSVIDELLRKGPELALVQGVLSDRSSPIG